MSRIKSIIGIILLMASANNVFGQTSEVTVAEVISRYEQTHLDTIECLGIFIGIGLALIVLQLLGLKRTINKLQGAANKEHNHVRATWWMVFHKKGVKLDDDTSSHEYDGIKEYDNNPPAW